MQHGRHDIPSSVTIAFAALLALTFFVSPAAGLGLGCAAAVFSFKHFTAWRTIRLALLAGLFLLLMVVPWGLRNADQMGSFILLRDNAGLQLALANYPEAVDPEDPLKTYHSRLRAIHPRFNTDLRHEMEAAGGEVAYNTKLKAEANRWIAANRVAFTQISLRHLSEYYFPRPWQFRHTGSGSFATARSLVVCAVVVLGLLGLAKRLKERSPGYLYVLPIVLVPGLTYLTFQPLPRYTYLIYGLMVFLAADFAIAPAVRKLKRRFAGQPHGSSLQHELT